MLDDLNDIETRTAKLVAAAKELRDVNRRVLSEMDNMDAEVEALRKDAERWIYARKALTWAPSGDGEIKWLMFLTMPEPDVSESGLTPDSVAQALDAAIDAAMAQTAS